MKHTLKITLLMIFLFLVSQVVGLAIVNRYIDHQTTEQTGNVTWVSLPMNISRPDIQESSSFLYIFGAIIIGTILLLILIRFRAYRLWKLWFFLAVALCLTIALGSFLPQYAALMLAIAIGILKIYWPDIYVQNITEVLIYGGLAAIFVPVINLLAMFILLILISFYDMYAVWKSKHMIKMAKFQSDSKIFAGLMIPYKITKKEKIVRGKVELPKAKSAILGGGDIGFPLLFAGVVMKGLMLQNPVWLGFLKVLVIPLFVSIALAFLLFSSKEDRFYPAMPFLSMGCLAGYLVVLLLG